MIKRRKTFIIIGSVLIVSGLLFLYFLQNKAKNPFLSCEKRVSEGYINTVPVEIEKLNESYMMFFYCKGSVESISISEPGNLDKYVGSHVSVVHDYVEVTRGVQCIKAPCPAITELTVSIKSISEVE